MTFLYLHPKEEGGVIDQDHLEIMQRITMKTGQSLNKIRKEPIKERRAQIKVGALIRLLDLTRRKLLIKRRLQ
jgi:hypothetical protein